MMVANRTFVKNGHRKMNKEQRRLLLIVKLGGMIPNELYKKYNTCSTCAHRFNVKNCNKIRLIKVNLTIGPGAFCIKWVKKNG